MIGIQPTSARTRRAAAAVTALVSVSVALTACSSSDSTTTASAPSAKFDQALHDSLPSSIKDSGELSFGAVWETPPIISVNPSDPTSPVGVAPDLAKGIGEILGVDATWQNLQWPAQLPGLQSGSVDALFGQVSATADREKSIVDLVPFQKQSFALLTAAGNPSNLTSFSALCGVSVGIPIGSSTGQMIKDASEKDCVAAGKPAIDFREFNGATAAVQALRGESIDAWFDATPSIVGIAESDSQTYSWAAVPETDAAPEYLAIAVSKDNPTVTSAVAEALKKLIADGTYSAAYSDVEGGTELAMTADQVVINPVTKTPVGQKS